MAMCGFVTHVNKLVAILRDISPTLINKKIKNEINNYNWTSFNCASYIWTRQNSKN
ncbi:hypothetical protein GCM10022422_09100 [Flavobacterium ginsengisoli]|uniref:Uncharacterized protein n=1 Tax=Flavobacterium ginsengisoli TaxID=871694 RepID=A0ABP7F6F9_9FLAO